MVQQGAASSLFEHLGDICAAHAELICHIRDSKHRIFEILLRDLLNALTDGFLRGGVPDELRKLFKYGIVGVFQLIDAGAAERSEKAFCSQISLLLLLMTEMAEIV